VSLPFTRAHHPEIGKKTCEISGVKSKYFASNLADRLLITYTPETAKNQSSCTTPSHRKTLIA
jgi:hypothetical protein